MTLFSCSTLTIQQFKNSLQNFRCVVVIGLICTFPYPDYTMSCSCLSFVSSLPLCTYCTISGETGRLGRRPLTIWIKSARLALSENGMASALLVITVMVSFCLLIGQFSVLDERLGQLKPALKDVLNSLLDPRLFSVDRGELHILLLHSRSLSEFHSLVKDIEATLVEILDSEQDMAEMYLTHWATTGYDIRDFSVAVYLVIKHFFIC